MFETVEGGLIRVGTDHFSWNIVNVALTIPVNQQMLVYQNIELNADLTLIGNLILLD